MRAVLLRQKNVPLYVDGSATFSKAGGPANLSFNYAWPDTSQTLIRYGSYSDGVGATNMVQSHTRYVQVAARITTSSLNLLH